MPREWRRSMRYRALVLAVAGLGTAACENPPPDYLLEMEQLTDAQGVSFHIPKFDVPYGEEVQDCYFIDWPQVGDDEPLWVRRVSIGLRPGSHHFNMYRVITDTPLSEAAVTGEDIDL